MEEFSTVLWIVGVAASFIVGRSLANSKSKKEIAHLKSQLSASNAEIEKLKSQLNPGIKPKPIEPNPNSQVSAKEAFLGNIDKFAPHLVNLEKGEVDWNKWSDVIIEISNNNLYHVWKSVLKKHDAWIRVMASWGLSFDSCIEFVYAKGREDLYDTEDGTKMQEGIKYSVLSPCWIVTTSIGKKSVVKKGVVKQKN